LVANKNPSRIWSEAKHQTDRTKDMTLDNSFCEVHRLVSESRLDADQ
jgi:hypothetical protein